MPTFSYRSFLLWTAALLVLNVAAFAAFNYHVDALGVFSSTPRLLSSSQLRFNGQRNHQIFFKYAVALHYLGQNFDAVLLGPSSSGTLPVNRATQGEAIYNASISGANLAEMLPIAERATRSPRVKTLYFCLDPYSVSTGLPKSPLRMETIERQAWGSTNLLKLYASNLLFRALGRWSGLVCDAYGVYTFIPASHPWWTDPRIVEEDRRRAESGYSLAPEAADQLEQLARLCRERGVQLRVFLPFRPASRYRGVQRSFARYRETVSSHLGGIEVYDPNLDPDPEVVATLADNRSFRDGWHLVKDPSLILWRHLYDHFNPPGDRPLRPGDGRPGGDARPPADDDRFQNE